MGGVCFSGQASCRKTPITGLKTNFCCCCIHNLTQVWYLEEKKERRIQDSRGIWKTLPHLSIHWCHHCRSCRKPAANYETCEAQFVALFKYIYEKQTKTKLRYETESCTGVQVHEKAPKGLPLPLPKPLKWFLKSTLNGRSLHVMHFTQSLEAHIWAGHMWWFLAGRGDPV